MEACLQANGEEARPRRSENASSVLVGEEEEDGAAGAEMTGVIAVVGEDGGRYKTLIGDYKVISGKKGHGIIKVWLRC